VIGEEAFVSLGSNLGDRSAQLARALRRMAELPGTSVTGLSPVFETDAVGPGPQGPHLNAVVRMVTAIEPRALLAALHRIEDEAGRSRGSVRWAARSLDLDLLLYGERVIDEPDLVLPHPRIAERAFVLEPLAALAPDRRHPTLGVPFARLAERVRDTRAVRAWRGDDAPLRAALGLGDVPGSRS
jgi:2-amino-4-hydroxy-6-hydroxymethyldihydropteridine diphosphokinase